jgi:hypothetical protein
MKESRRLVFPRTSCLYYGYDVLGYDAVDKYEHSEQPAASSFRLSFSLLVFSFASLGRLWFIRFCYVFVILRNKQFFQQIVQC